MTLVDTSAWVEYLRASGSTTHEAVRDLISSDAPMHTTEVVVMEVLAGARDEMHSKDLRRLLTRCELVPIAGFSDYEDAASLYRRCRRGGEMVRALNDCLVGAVAIRADLDLLHQDRDFEVLARHCPLRLHLDLG